MPHRHPFHHSLRLGLVLSLLALAFGWGPAAAAPSRPLAPSLALTVTVGLDATICPTTTELELPPDGGLVNYCYEVTNTGDVTLNWHDLVDSEFGLLLNNFAYSLAPVASVFLTNTATLTATTVTSATWTGYNNPGPVDVAAATAAATVTVASLSLALDVTVGTDDQVCATASALDLVTGAAVTYCYTV